jgi:hypothetical protein
MCFSSTNFQFNWKSSKFNSFCNQKIENIELHLAVNPTAFTLKFQLPLQLNSIAMAIGSIELPSN